MYSLTKYSTWFSLLQNSVIIFCHSVFIICHSVFIIWKGRKKNIVIQKEKNFHKNLFQKGIVFKVLSKHKYIIYSYKRLIHINENNCSENNFLYYQISTISFNIEYFNSTFMVRSLLFKFFKILININF